MPKKDDDSLEYTTTSDSDESDMVIEERIPRVFYWQLFRYATPLEIAAIILGLVISSASGCIFPVGMIYYGQVVDNFVNPDKLLDSIRQQCVIFSILGAIGLVLGFLQSYLLIWVADRQIERIKLLFFKAVLKQEVAWHERHPVGSIITQISDNMDQIQQGMGGNLANFFRDMSLFVAGLIVSFSEGWKLTLVAVAMIPLIAVVFTCLALVIQLFVKVEIEAYSAASSWASEVLSSVRTVFAFGGQKYATERYDRELGTAEKAGVKKGILLGASVGMISVSIFTTVAVLFYYGCILIRGADQYKPGTVVLIIMNLVYGSIAVGRAMPLMEFFMKAAGNAAPIFATIERNPPIDIEMKGIKPKKFKGHIEFKHIDFHYPQRPDVQILKDFNLKIKPGERLAFVGPSGSGKSTIVSLLLRLYDPVSGTITIDGDNIRDINLPWLRHTVGSVSQEPMLFSGSVKSNIRIGMEEVDESDIIEAAKLANAHKFITALPKGYETWIGEGGASLSGGQKQRVAIARALVRKPKVLLLDEATSALDTNSERLVQESINNLGDDVTVIMIAHRLSTVVNCDRIVVMENGVIKEVGNHKQLLQMNGLYARMIKTGSDEEKEKSNESLSEYESESESETTTEESTVRHRGRRRGDSSEFSETTRNSKSYVTNSEDEDEVYYHKESTTLRTLRWNRPEAFLMFIGFLGAAVSGAIEPSFALLFAETFDVFIKLFYAPDWNKIKLITGLMSMVGFIKFFAQLLQYWLLAVAGERLTRRVRKALFEAMLRQEPGWFDRPENRCGILTARLANEAPQLRKVSGERGGVVVESITITIVTIVLAFYYSWQLALVNMAFLPALVFVGALQVRDMGRNRGSGMVVGSEVVQECLIAQRTVATLCLEEYFYNKFAERATEDKKKKLSARCSYSVVNAFALAVQFFQNAAIYYLGAVLIDNGTLKQLALFRSISVANFGAQGLGRAASFLPDLNSAINGAKNIYETLDRKTKLDVYEGEIPAKPLKGSIKFQRVRFAYPTRKTVPVLRGFNYNVPRGSNIAFVGESGCGKSTCLQLLQRLYDVGKGRRNGCVYMDGMDVRTVQASWLRSQIGVVQQEPNLFDLTIRDNIAIGDLEREIPMSEIIAAAKKANIHDFVKGLPEGYDTRIGLRGSQLSGGQKQRVAIARALVRNPKILLLDEATSALDVESERVVQAALERAMRDSERTCLVVAHRLSALQQCDEMVVLSQGKAVESGTHEELMAKKGHYYSLYKETAEAK